MPSKKRRAHNEARDLKRLGPEQITEGFGTAGVLARIEQLEAEDRDATYRPPTEQETNHA